METSAEVSLAYLLAFLKESFFSSPSLSTYYEGFGTHNYLGSIKCLRM